MTQNRDKPPIAEKASGGDKTNRERTTIPIEWQDDPVYDWLLQWCGPGFNIHVDKGTGIFPKQKGRWKITTEHTVRMIRQGEEKTIKEAKTASLQAAIKWAKGEIEDNNQQNDKMDELKRQATETLALPGITTLPEEK